MSSLALFLVFWAQWGADVQACAPEAAQALRGGDISSEALWGVAGEADWSSDRGLDCEGVYSAVDELAQQVQLLELSSEAPLSLAQERATAYCAGWADAHEVYWHDTPEVTGGFQCVTDAYPGCGDVRGGYCVRFVAWSTIDQ